MSKTRILNLLIIPLFFTVNKVAAFQYEIIQHENVGLANQEELKLVSNNELTAAIFTSSTDEQTNYTIKLLQNDSWTDLDLPTLSGQEILSLELNASNELFIGTSEGLYSYQDGTLNQLAYNYYITHISVNKNTGELYFSEEDAVYKFNNVISDIEELFSGLIIDELYTRNDNDVIVKSGYDIYEYSNNELVYSFIPGSAKYIALDKNDRLWIITYDSQILKENIVGSYWEHKNFNEDVLVAEMTNMNIDKDGNIWFANQSQTGRLIKWDVETEEALWFNIDLLFYGMNEFLIDDIILANNGDVFLTNNNKKDLIQLSQFDFVLNAEQASNDLSWSFGPNPSTDYILVSLGESLSEGQISIIGTNGNILKSQNIANQVQFQIDLNEMASGMYFLQIVSADKKAVRKFIKN